ncbi:MAG: hypothetical protein B6D64_01325 [Bacteroidetes bacterium 4484_276]|nr:MAG: hypothetical protein B6D64_01325 [Bacteroidetes bacterium 4484_276]
MKSLKILSVMFLAAMLAFSACKKDDDPPLAVEISGLAISDSNTVITVTFNQGVYGNAEKTTGLDATSFQLVIYSTNQVTASYQAVHVAGEATAIIEITYEDELTGGEEIEIIALANKVFGEEGNALGADSSKKIEVINP